jgi:hypothetical protein
MEIYDFDYTDDKGEVEGEPHSSTHSSGFEVWAYRYNAVNRLMGIEQSKSEENKIPPLEEGIDPSWINSFKGCI